MTISGALQILGLPQGATEQQIRRAHRKHAKLWHPDRFPNDDEMQAEAIQKMKEINLALEVLERAQFATGADPATSFNAAGDFTADPEESSPTNAATDARTQSSDNHAAPTEEEALHPALQAKAESGNGWLMWVAATVAVLILLVSVSYFTNNAVPHPNKNAAPARLPAATQSPTPSPRQQQRPPVVQQPAMPVDPLAATPPEKPRRTRPTNPPDRRPRTFTLGSSSADVAYAQGPPSRIDGAVWYFGEFPHQSEVGFYNDVVVRWDIDPKTPLRVSLLSEPAAAGEWPPEFTVGSPPDHVAAVQGVPSRISHNEWYFGRAPYQSRVTFVDSRVVSWDANPKLPLRVSHPGQLQETAPAHALCSKAFDAEYAILRIADRAEAHRLFREAAEQGNPAACVHVAQALIRGSGNVEGGQWEESDRWFTRAEENARSLATRGCPDGMFAYAHLLLRAKPEKRNVAAALEWLREAAAAKHIPSQIALAHMLGDNEESPAISQQRFALYQAAAEQGAREAFPWLANFYLEGNVVPRNQDHAAKTMEDAALSNVDSAFHLIAHALQNGQITKLRSAEGSGDPQSIAWRLLTEACEINPNSSMNHARCLASCYFDGTGTKVDAEKGLRLMVQAARYDPMAQFELAERIRDGNKVKQSSDTAATWYGKSLEGFREAAQRGDGEAALRCAGFYEQGLVVERDLGEASLWWAEAAVSPKSSIRRLAREKVRSYGLESKASGQ